MPGIKKDLYLAKSLEELNNSRVKTAVIPTKLDIDKLLKSSAKILTEAKHHYHLGDEEKSYVYYMRYLNIVTFANKVKYKKEVTPAVADALQKAEELADSLEKRYNENMVNDEKVIPAVKEDVIYVETLTNGLIVNGTGILPGTKTKNAEPKSKSNQSINSTQLFNMLYDGNETVAIFDVRKIEDFVKSQMRHLSCVSVPEDILRPGMTASAIEQLLPKKSKHTWNKRDKINYIVLMDWNSSLSTLKDGSPLHILREALTKWSPKVCLQSDPYILENGYEDFILHYPTETTDPNIKKSVLGLNTSSATLISLDIDYPDLNEINENYEKTKSSNIETIDLTEEEEYNKDMEIPSVKSVRRDSATSKVPKIPSVDRALKPCTKPEPKSAWPSEKHIEEEKRKIGDSYNRLETMTEEQLSNTVQRLKKEQEFAMLCYKKETEASEEMRKIMSEQADQVLEKINTLEIVNKNLEEGRRQLEEENMRLKMRLSHQPDDASQSELTIKQKLEEQQKRDAEVKKLRNERRRKELEEKARLEKKSAEPSPPVIAKESFPINKKMETTQLKDEPQESKRGGLRRSNSSPNIAQLVENFNKIDVNPGLNTTPLVNRQAKPTNLSMGTPTVNRILKPQENSVVKQRNFNPVYTSQGNSQTGLRNLGNTCFMNAVIQCLANTIGLVDYLLYRDYTSDVRASGSKGEVVEELSTLLQHLRGGNCRSITPLDFKNTVSRYLRICIGNEQQDAHEFLTKLMEKLHMEINRGQSNKSPPPETDKKPVSVGIQLFWNWHTIRNNSAIQEIFEGLLLSQLTCLYCKSVSNSYEVFSCLSVPISSTSRCSLYDCIKNFLKTERISGDAGWNCPTCKQKREAEKQMFIVKLPKVLVIHLKRFSYEGMWRSKLKTMVNFPLTNLDMEPYTSDDCKTYQTNYSLYGVVNHFGTLEGGHYIAICKSNEKWFKYDDQDVSEISSSSVATDAAYIMFYSMIPS